MKRDFRFIMILAIFLTAFIFIGSGFAADVSSVGDVGAGSDDIVVSDVSGVANVDVDVDVSNELKASNVGNFTELNQTINDAISEGKTSITLNKSYKYNANDGLSNGIVISKDNIIIDGNGFTIDGLGMARIFNINANGVTIKNVNFVNGSCDGDGGAIKWVGDIATIENCNFTNCSSNNNLDNGGVISLNVNESRFNDCNFVNCSAYSGNIYIFGNITAFSNCNFINCVANKNGVISLNVKNVGLQDCTFTNCSSVDGGAINIIAILGYITDCNFTDCSSTKTGGAIAGINLIPIIENCNFKNCSSVDGGAINIIGVYLYVTTSNFKDCSASEDGGAIHMRSISTANVDTCTFVNCSSGRRGSAIHISGDNIGVNYNIFENNHSPNGTDIYIGSKNPIVNCDYNFFAFQNNVTEFPSGLINRAIPNNWVVLNIDESGDEYVVKFVLNNGSDLDKFMPDYTANLTINNENAKEITIKNNTFKDTLERAVYKVNSINTGNLLAEANLEIPNDSFTALNELIINSKEDTIVLNRDYKFYDDYDDKLIGGIVIGKDITIDGNGHTIDGLNLTRSFNVTANNVIFKNINFVNCSASNSKGGAIYWNSTKGTVSGCSFVDCSAYRGGAIYFNAYGNVSGCSFVDCSVNHESGGAIYFGTGGSVNYCIFDNNKAKYGSAIYSNKGYVNSDYNFFAFQNNVIKFPRDLIYGNDPNNWVVLDITTDNDGLYYVKFVMNNGDPLDNYMPDYIADLSINGVNYKINIKHNEFKDTLVNGDYLLSSPNSAKVLASAYLDDSDVNYDIDDIDSEKNITNGIENNGIPMEHTAIPIFTLILALLTLPFAYRRD